MISAAVTGGIASGKTQVLRVARGFPEAKTLQADDLAKEIYSPDNPHFEEVVDILGTEILNDRGEIDLESVAEKVFSDGELLKKLEEIAHPYVRERIKTLMVEYENRGTELFLVEIPLLFQSASVETNSFDRIILVTAEENLRIERLMERDGVSETMARKRVQLQKLPRNAREESDFVVEADGSIEETRRKAEEIIRTMLNQLS